MSKFSVIFLAGGYGTRLMKDLVDNDDHDWDYVKNYPKALIKLAGTPLLTHWIAILGPQSDNINKICLVTNDKFYQQFVEWRSNLMNTAIKEKIIVYNNFSSCDENKLGSMVDLQHGINILKAEDEGVDGKPILIIASDTIFSKDFSLDHFLAKYERLKKSIIVAAPCPKEEVHKHGIIEVDSDNPDLPVLSFLEKPLLEETESRIQSPCCYLLSSMSTRCILFHVQYNYNL